MLDVKLVVVGGANEGDEFPLELPAVLGRGRDVSLPLPHPLVSRQHCELVEDGDGMLRVRDLGSTNGTFVGSERIDESILAHGQLLTIGTVTFRAYLADEPHSAAELGDAAVVPTEHKFDGPAGANQETTTLATADTSPAHPAHPPRVGQRAK